MSLLDTLCELHNIRMKEGESMTAFSNPLLAECDPNNMMAVYKLVPRLSAQVQRSRAILMYNNSKSLDDIVEACNKVWKVMLAPSNKGSRTQVNFVYNASEDEEEETGQAAVLWMMTQPACKDQSAQGQNRVSPNQRTRVPLGPASLSEQQ